VAKCLNINVLPPDEKTCGHADTEIDYRISEKQKYVHQNFM
jgi:hypothetical protein